MTRVELRQKVVDTLARIAPEVDPATLRGDVPFRDQVDLDSVDYLNFVIALHSQLGVEVPEADYARLSSLNGAVEYLAAKLGGVR
jgi:acyl carrier protein